MHMKQDGIEIVYTCGGCAEDGFIADAFDSYRLVSKEVIEVGRVSVT
jgi:hypothetical protein